MSARDWLRVTLVGLSLLVAGSAAAAEERHGAEPDILEGTIGNFIITLIVFAIVIVVLGKFAWPHVLNLLNEREKRIRDSLEDAKREREEADRVLEKYTRQIEQARDEAAAIVDRGRRNAGEVSRRIQDQARQEAAEMIERAKREIQLATDTAKKEVYDAAADLAVNVAGRIIRKELSAQDHKDLVEESLDRMRAADTKVDTKAN